jgi:sulfoquinovosidase
MRSTPPSDRLSGLRVGARVLREMLRSRSPALRERRGAPPTPGPLPAPVEGPLEVARALRLRESEVTVRAVPVSGYWVWFLRDPVTSQPLPAPEPEQVAGDRVRVRLAATSADANHVELRLPLVPGERIVGFGERFNGVDQRGWKLETWTEEGAFGTGEQLSPLLTRLGVGCNPYPKGPGFSYKPVPWFFSSRGYGVYLETFAPAFFDVGATDPNELRCEVMAREVTVWVVYGPGPRRLVEHLADLTDGRPSGLPDWALAPWLDAVGGEARVRHVARTAREHGVPSSAIWTEDWQGMEPRPFGDSKWSYDSIFPVLRKPCNESYPDMPGLIDDLHGDGFKFLSYYYPYVNEVDEDYGFAESKGYFLKDPKTGQTKRIKLFLDWAGQVDLENPEARAWYKEELRKGLRMGFDGWMADFGEYTPVDVVTHAGEDGIAHHNRYPLLWAQLNREVFEEERPDGDFVFFSRSGSPGQQRYTPVFWTGDSDTTFERWDGMASNPRGLITAGLSGFPVWTVDVGGYMCVYTRARDAEVLARWTELGAFLAVMRTHHGTHLRRNVQFDHSPETLAHFATYARFHTALFPLRKTLLGEAEAHGWPVARPLLLEHPDDPLAWTTEDQWLLGPLLVAPVTDRGAGGRDVYLPAGVDWIDLWTGRRCEGGTTVHAEAPVGRIPLYLRSDGVLPTFDTRVDTLVRRAQVSNPHVTTLDDAEGSLTLFVGPDFRGPFALYDGTVIEHAAQGDGPARGGGGEDHALLPPDIVKAWPVVGQMEGADATLPFGDGALRVRGPHPRRITVRAT